jgi:hypothetical protein
MREIFRCEELESARRSASHPCSKIVGAQAYSFAGNPPFQVPEPWRGNLRLAPLLFISSNPAIDQTDDSPWNTEPDETIAEYFNLGFGETFPRILHPNRLAGRYRETNVKFWSSIQKFAAEFFERNKQHVFPDQDFAITEVVHCKSPSEYGVDKNSRAKCFELHMPGILQRSAAVVVCTLGRHAEEAFRNLTVIMSKGEAIMVSLAHPNARRLTAGENDPPPLPPNVAGLPLDRVTKIREKLRS